MGVCGDTGKRVRAWLENQKLLEAREGTCGVRSGQFWWQRTDLDEIYLMKVFVSRTKARRWGF
jgi:hypothetical protein